jgi:hypothetical protein
MLQIAYFSTAAVPQTAETAHELLVTSRVNNRRDGITGLLVAGGNRYLQVIEGPRRPMERLMGLIRADRRHLGICTLLSQPIFKRNFEGWSMAFRREPALGQFDTFPEVVRYLTEQVQDEDLRVKIRNFARVFIAHPLHTEVTPWRLAG